MDYRELLEKYIRHVGAVNIDPDYGGPGWNCLGQDRPDGFTDEQWAELHQLAGTEPPHQPTADELIAAQEAEKLREQQEFTKRLARGRIRWEEHCAMPWWQRALRALRRQWRRI